MAARTQEVVASGDVRRQSPAHDAVGLMEAEDGIGAAQASTAEAAHKVGTTAAAGNAAREESSGSEGADSRRMGAAAAGTGSGTHSAADSTCVACSGGCCENLASWWPSVDVAVTARTLANKGASDPRVRQPEDGPRKGRQRVLTRQVC